LSPAGIFPRPPKPPRGAAVFFTLGFGVGLGVGFAVAVGVGFGLGAIETLGFGVDVFFGLTLDIKSAIFFSYS
jgi:hypothetical protein